MNDKPTNEDEFGQDGQSNTEASRRSFIAKASAGGAVGIGAILGMSHAASAHPVRAASARQEASAEERIIARASTDAEYRRRLIANPHGVIGETVGSAMPPGITKRPKSG